MFGIDTVLIIALAMAAAASAAGAYSSYESGRQQKKAADFNARMAEYNAEQSRIAAEEKSRQYEKAGERRLSQMRQQYAKAGVELEEGTPLTVLMDSASELAKDVVRIKRGGEAQAWGFLSESEYQRSIGKSQYQAGMIGAGTSLLGGASRVSSMYAGSGSRYLYSGETK